MTDDIHTKPNSADNQTRRLQKEINRLQRIINRQETQLQQLDKMASANEKININLYQELEELTRELEVKNRELEIETALERVRAVAMSMRKPDDLAGIGETLFAELKKLGFNDLRNTEIIINHDAIKSVTSYYYSDYGVTGNIDIDYTTNPTVKAWAQEMRKADDAFVEVVIPEKEIVEWRKYRLALGYVPDPKLDEARKVYYYSYSIGLGALSISSFQPVLAEQIAVLERFRNVFDLAYRRYADIALAKAQAREARIEAALERVRARTMAMQKSDELAKTSFMLFEQLKKLGEVGEQISIGIWSEAEKTLDVYATLQGNQWEKAVKAELDEQIVIKKIYKAWKEQKKSLVIDLTGKELREYNKFRRERGGAQIKIDDKYPTDRWVIHAAFFSHGLLSFSSNTLHSSETIELLERFAGVFDLTYTRFLDLQKAEAQAREAQIEAALERVRSQTMGMQKSAELKEVIRVIYEQFVQLKINVDHAGFVVDYTPKGDWHFWIADEQDIPSKITHPYFESVWANQFNEAKEKGSDFFATNLNFEEKNKFYNELLLFVPGLPEASKDFYLSCPGLAISTALLENVGLYIENFSGIPYSDEENKILMRFGKVFQQTYTRFLDLQKSEAQAREAQIEAALERVRSRTMGMQKSEELPEVANLLFQQIQALGVPVWSTAFNIFSKDKRTVICNVSSEGQLQPSFSLPLTEEKSFKEWYDAIKSKETLFVQELGGKDLERHYEYLFTLPGVKDAARPLEEEGISLPTYQINHLCSFKQGFLLFITYEKIPEAHPIFHRFTAVFQQTFTRFLDLQKAEAQAREAQIEAALERVRARTMAMQRSDELAETAAILFKQLIYLGIEPNRLYIAIIKNEKGDAEVWITDEDGSKVSSGFAVNFNENSSFQKMFLGWKKQIKSIAIDMQGKELEEYFQHLGKLNAPFKAGLSQKRRVQNIAYFSQGFIGLASPDPQPAERTELLERFAAAFNLTYTRFNDLQQAEEQNKIIQAENERKTRELEEARQLQIAMLPKELPQVPNLKIAVFMEAATEVGGDYYDFHVAKDGTLTTVIGDATGHGLQAGMMVATAKGLFNSLAHAPDLVGILQKSSAAIKSMGFPRLYMAMMIARFRENQLQIAAAGMPYALVYRVRSKQVEEVVLKGMPLGGFPGFPYQQKNIRLNKGDTVLFLSDGLEEMFNEQGEILGDAQVKTLFAEAGGKSPEGIIKHLREAGTAWAGNRPQLDDVTMVTIRMA